MLRGRWLRMADFELIPAPVFSPTQCILCHGGGRVVDTKVSVPGTQYGRVYVCELCAGGIARAVGWVDPLVHAAAEDALGEARALVAELEAELVGLRDRWQTLLVPAVAGSGAKLNGEETVA